MICYIHGVANFEAHAGREHRTAPRRRKAGFKVDEHGNAAEASSTFTAMGHTRSGRSDHELACDTVRCQQQDGPPRPRGTARLASRDRGKRLPAWPEDLQSVPRIDRQAPHAPPDALPRQCGIQLSRAQHQREANNAT